jgi:DNA-binding CsgD family transcriptional regulator
VGQQYHSALREDLANSDNHSKWLNSVIRVAKQFGFPYATLMLMPKPSDRFFSELIMATNLPNKLVQTLDQSQLLHSCPVFATFAFSTQPQFWSLGELDTDDQNLIVPITAWAEASITGGVIFSFHSINAERFLLRFEGNLEPISQTDLNDLLMQSHIAFDHFQKLRRNNVSATKNLTKREIEVVKWTAQGKTSSEIAAILSLSDHTVNAYMNNAIKKLECVNRTQLVAKAIRLKLI